MIERGLNLLKDKPSNSNWLLLLSYDGFNYHGWQVQNEENTIEGELEKAIRTLTGKCVKVFGAGRTDSKVHAINQTAHFFSNADFSAESWCSAFNAVLPPDIAVKCVLPVSSTFHARHSSLAKRYRYLIHNKPYPSPFNSHYSWWLRRPLDLNAMRQAARHFIGEHDFSAFRSSRCLSPSPVKIINDIIVSPIHSPFASLKIEVEANSFLQHMVRIIIGTLAAVGEKRLFADDIPSILEDKDRRKSGKTAPPYGLYVQKVYYDEREVRWPSQVIDL